MFEVFQDTLWTGRRRRANAPNGPANCRAACPSGISGPRWSPRPNTLRYDRYATKCASIQETGLFDAVWYAHRYPDVDASGMRPIRHYAEHGAQEDRSPNPWFDPVWYRATHRLAPREDPLFHYVSGGEAAGLRPSPNFDPVLVSRHLRPGHATIRARRLFAAAAHPDRRRPVRRCGRRSDCRNRN